MYKITCITDEVEYVLYDPRSQYKVTDPKLTLELNKAGTLTFGVQTTHANKEQIIPLMSDIVVYEDAEAIYYGRSITQESDFYKTGKITCEGDLAFLFDSMIRSYDFSGSISGFLTLMLNNHNAQVEDRKKIYLGNVTVTDSNGVMARKSSVPARTLTTITDKLINIYDGYIRIRHVGGIKYLDYLADYAHDCTQKIEFRKNLVDLNQFVDATAIRTVLIPLGAKQEDSEAYLTIESVNGGLDYIENAGAIAAYGRIYESVQWEDVTVPGNLLTKAQAWLEDNILASLTIKLTAADLSKLNVNVGKIAVGDWITAVSKPHGLNTQFLVAKRDIDLANPALNGLVLGDTRETLTAANRKKQSTASALQESVATTVKQGEKYNSVSIDHVYGFMSSAEVDGSTHTVKMNGTDGFVAEGTVAGKEIVVTMSPEKPFCLSIDGYDQIYVKNGILVTSPYDVNEDGLVDQEDLDIVTYYVLHPAERAAGLALYPKMDVNHDGIVSSSDLTLICRAGNIRTFFDTSTYTTAGGTYLDVWMDSAIRNSVIVQNGDYSQYAGFVVGTQFTTATNLRIFFSSALPTGQITLNFAYNETSY